MAVYDYGKILKMTRTALGISPTNLCRNICSTRTLFRIENGLVKSKRNIYLMLLERMERPVFQISLIKCSSDPTWFELRNQCNNANSNYAHEELKFILNSIQNTAEENILFQQLLKIEKAILRFRTYEISAETAYSLLDSAIRLTAPHYTNYLDSFFPYTLEECRFFMVLGNICNAMHRNDQALELYKMILRCIDAGYMYGTDVDDLQQKVLFNYSLVLTDSLHYEESLCASKKLIDYGLENDYGNPITNSMAEISWVYKQQKSNGCDFITEEERKKYVRKIVYLCIATGNAIIEDRMRTRNSDAWEE